MRKVVKFNETDNVAVVLYDIQPGDSLQVGSLTVSAKQAIPYGHKIALADLAVGETVYKYGEPIARCTKAITEGEWVHVHNVESIRGLGRR